MSRSYRTQKVSVIAEKNIKRNMSGDIIYPRIVVRKARQGEYHPLPKKILKVLLQIIPIEYIYGLQKIELCSDNDNKSYARYKAVGRDKIIVLYSLPKVFWAEKDLSNIDKSPLTIFDSYVNNLSEIEKRKWESNYTIGLCYFIHVFMHELGHHFVKQYKNKNKVERGIKVNENYADSHWKKLCKMLIKKTPNNGIKPTAYSSR